MGVLKLATKVEIKESSGKGLGVFATEFISRGEIIEECHLIPVPILRGQKIFIDYVFGWPTNLSLEMVLPLGYGCIYNHSDNNNAIWQDHPSLKAFQFIAIKDISPGEEICTFYGGDIYWDEKTKTKLL